MGEQETAVQAALNGQLITQLKSDLEAKHKQNRRSIHRLANDVQKCVDLITGIRIANARWNIGAGMITAIVVKVIDHFIK